MPKAVNQMQTPEWEELPLEDSELMPRVRQVGASKSLKFFAMRFINVWATSESAAKLIQSDFRKKELV